MVVPTPGFVASGFAPGPDYLRMHHDRIDDPAWDQPRWAAAPPKRVVICTTPRSGSYLLCRQMINAGLGLPTEYLRTRTKAILRRRWGVSRHDEHGYFDEVERWRTTPNGLFATKVQWHDLRTHWLAHTRWLSRADLLVFLHRRDLAAQAVSWQVSLATGFWSFDTTAGPRQAGVTLDDPEMSVKLAHTVAKQNDEWRSILRELNRPTLDVVYEEFVGAQGTLLATIAPSVGLAPEAWCMPPPEAHDNRLPAEVEEARSRLLKALRKRLAHGSGSTSAFR